MALNKEDIREIVNDSEKRIFVHVDTRIDSLEQKLSKKIENQVGTLAAMTAREFKVVHGKIDDLGKKLDRELA